MVYVKNRRHDAFIPGPHDKPCKLCASLDYRVEGKRCIKCGLSYKARIPVTLDYILEQAGREAK